jgi:VIT1/CCC1 family predicted Fe2+/Mn2+ transporter
LTSGVITTLGLIVGLNSSTKSKLAVTAGIIILAIADGLSDARGIHVSEEAEGEHTSFELWESTLCTFLSKLFVALSFIVPIELLDLSISIYVSITWGLLLISIFSVYMAKTQGTSPYKVLAEHVLVAIIVVIAAHLVGNLINEVF